MGSLSLTHSQHPLLFALGLNLQCSSSFCKVHCLPCCSKSQAPTCNHSVRLHAQQNLNGTGLQSQDVDVAKSQEGAAVRTKEELLSFNETHTLRLHPDVLQLFLAMGADRPYVIWCFLNIKFGRHNFLLANDRGMVSLG